jgi:hypothetical protein
MRRGPATAGLGKTRFAARITASRAPVGPRPTRGLGVLARCGGEFKRTAKGCLSVLRKEVQARCGVEFKRAANGSGNAMGAQVRDPCARASSSIRKRRKVHALHSDAQRRVASLDFVIRVDCSDDDEI